jgi:hypothetical protein
MLVNHSSRLILTFLVAGLSPLAPCLAQNKKYGGELFDSRTASAPAVDTPATASDAPSARQGPVLSIGGDYRTLSSPSALPPLNVKVFVAPNRSLPDVLRDRVSESSRRFASPSESGRQYLLTTPNREALDAAISNADVRRIEVDRPQGFLPSPGILPSDLPPIGGQIQVFNRDARITHFVPDFLATFAASTDKGSSVLAAVFDEGSVRRTHVEFATDRVAVHTTRPPSRHSTHVAGTMSAKGARSEAIGMAEKLKLLSFDWLDDLNELDAAGGDSSSPIRASNHSYGPLAGWAWDQNLQAWFWWGDTTLSQDEDAKFGKYTGDNSQLDSILSRRPHLVTFAAAGNDRSDGPSVQPVQHYAIGRHATTGQLEWQVSTRQRRRDGHDQGGLDTIGGLGLSKNAICIGAIRDVVNVSDVIVTTPFSNWGPSDDGRVKPDLVANGDLLLSTSNADDDAYVELSGTSMASPTAAGIGSLLIENYQKVKGDFPTSDIIKAILVHSATDAGAPGPDPAFGWGSINTLAAGRIISGQGGAWIKRDTVNSGAGKTFGFAQPADGRPVRATLVWIDPAGAANTGGLDDSTPTLVNDLDLTVVAPDGAVFNPYSLVRSSPASPATRTGPNRVDNVEVVDAPPLAGNWTVRVRVNNLGSGASQSFALVVTGLTAR